MAGGEFAGPPAGGAFAGGTAGSSFGSIISAGVSFYEYLRNPKKFYITNPFQGFEDLVAEGLPVREKTIEAVLRLGESANPVVKQFGRDLATLEGGGVVLSTSGGAGRAALNKIYSKAVTGLESQGFSKHDANRLLVNVLSSHTATPGIAIPASPPRLFRVPSGSVPAPRIAPQGGGPVNYFPTSGQDFSDQFSTLPAISPQTADKVAGYLQPLNRFFSNQALNDYTGMSEARDLANQIGIAQKPLGTTIAAQPSAGNARQPLEIIDPRDCPSCNPHQAQEKALLTSQRGQLQDELRTENQQHQDQQDQQRQQQIEQFRQLEHQPAQQRDIPNEIQQKMNLLQQVGNELAQLQHEIDNQTPGGGGNPPPATQTGSYPSPSAAIPAGGGGTTIYGQPEDTEGTEDEHQHELEEKQIFIQQNPSDHGGDPTKAVKFCVGCVTQNDALKFLNGEPSACSVMGYGNAE